MMGMRSEPIEEVFPEGPFFYFGQEILVGGGQDPHIHGQGLLSAQALDLRVCRTLSSLIWAGGGISPISSRKTVPPWACSKCPAFWRRGP